MVRKRIQAYLDLGSSATKGVYWSGGKFHWLWMLPQCNLMSSMQIQRLRSDLEEAKPESSAFVQLGEKVYSVGALARAFSGDSGIVLPKKERAVYKVLAAIGVMALHEGVGEEFELDLGVVLPLAEYWQDREKLVAAINEATASFGFRGRSLKVHLGTVQMRPEGVGLYIGRRIQLLKEDVDVTTKVITVLMFGHRNLSILTFDKGSPPTESNSSSQGPGFVEYLKQVAAECSFVAPDDPALLEAILSGADQMRVQGRSEVFPIKAAKALALEYYLQKVGDFLIQYLPSVNGELLISGGAAYQMREQLTKWFKDRSMLSSVIWSDALVKEFEYFLPGGTSTVDAIRLADAFGLFKALTEAKAMNRAAA